MVSQMQHSMGKKSNLNLTDGPCSSVVDKYWPKFWFHHMQTSHIWQNVDKDWTWTKSGQFLDFISCGPRPTLGPLPTNGPLDWLWKKILTRTISGWFLNFISFGLRPTQGPPKARPRPTAYPWPIGLTLDKDLAWTNSGWFLNFIRCGPQPTQGSPAAHPKPTCGPLPAHGPLE